MADRTPTRFNRLQAGENLNTPAAGHVEAFGETILSQQVTLSALSTASNPKKMQIAGIFDVEAVRLSFTDALTTTSALIVNTGIAGTVGYFKSSSVSAGATNEVEHTTVPGSAVTPNWLRQGSAAAVTTVQVYHSAASVAAALSAQVSFHYILRG